MYDTDRGIEELADRRGEEQLAVAWLAERLRDFVDLNPGFETAIDRLASWLARLDDEDDLLRALFPNDRGCERRWTGACGPASDVVVATMPSGCVVGPAMPLGVRRRASHARRECVVVPPCRWARG